MHCTVHLSVYTVNMPHWWCISTLHAVELKLQYHCCLCILCKNCCYSSVHSHGISNTPTAVLVYTLSVLTSKLSNNNNTFYSIKICCSRSTAVSASSVLQMLQPSDSVWDWDSGQVSWSFLLHRSSIQIAACRQHATCVSADDRCVPNKLKSSSGNGIRLGVNVALTFEANWRFRSNLIDMFSVN